MRDRDYILGANIARLYAVNHLLPEVSEDKTVNGDELRDIRRKVSAILDACHARLEAENDAAWERREARKAAKEKNEETRSKLSFKLRDGQPYEGLEKG